MKFVLIFAFKFHILDLRSNERLKKGQFMIRKVDDFINYLILTFMLCGGMFIHLLTALTIKSYSGSLWGFVSFLLPGLAEIYLITLQLRDNMYNYMIIVAGFIAVTATLGTIWFVKNLLKARMTETA